MPRASRGYALDLKPGRERAKRLECDAAARGESFRGPRGVRWRPSEKPRDRSARSRRTSRPTTPWPRSRVASPRARPSWLHPGARELLLGEGLRDRVEEVLLDDLPVASRERPADRPLGRALHDPRDQRAARSVPGGRPASLSFPACTTLRTFRGSCSALDASSPRTSPGASHGRPRRHFAKMSAQSPLLGRPTSIFRSTRPSRRSAGSRASGRFVAMRTSAALSSIPSISARNCGTIVRSVPSRPGEPARRRGSRRPRREDDRRVAVRPCGRGRSGRPLGPSSRSSRRTCRAAPGPSSG